MKKVAVIFGGKSTEHDVSIVSGTSVIENLDKSKYNIYPIYISKNGKWYKYLKPINEIKILKMSQEIEEIEELTNIIEYLKQMDVIFPVLHGLGGEDGTIQGLFELIDIPYVGCGVLASSIGMDKIYAKIIFSKANLKQAKYEYIKVINNKYIYVDKEFNEIECNIEDVCDITTKNLKYPIFVKPSNSGSSVGVKKALNKEELKKAIKNAKQYDTKVIIEQGINGREIECAVLGNNEVIASCLGEILPAEEFYSFDAKYIKQESKTLIPASIDKEISEKIRKFAIKAFKAIDGKGLSRVDFFVENETNEIYINEINTIPGFTQISMYPKLFEQVGVKYTNLLDKLIDLANTKQF